VANLRILGARFAIGDPIGEGAMGIVYEAEDLSDGRTVAVKVLSPTRRGEASLEERMVREARAAAAVRHPNIVRIIAVGTRPAMGPGTSGMTYIVMERMRGESLEDLVDRQGPLPVPLATAITAEILAGLDAAHARGVVHRDLKPGNVFRTREGVVKLFDFGLSVRYGSHGFSLSLTPEGTVCGSPAYMSPEQALGDEPIDGRSDQYAAGVVLYEMLTGEPPFDGPSTMEVLERVVREAPRPIRPRRRDVSPALEAVILRALMKKRVQRFPSAAAMAEALADATG
jgi:eukaryotic-like serine/threonine-protein kinase